MLAEISNSQWFLIFALVFFIAGFVVCLTQKAYNLACIAVGLVCFVAYFLIGNGPV